jgi:hypothetical protein
MASLHPIESGPAQHRASSIWTWIAILLAIAAYPVAIFIIHALLHSASTESALWLGFLAMVLLAVAGMILASIALILDSPPMQVSMLALVIGAATMLWAGILFVSNLVGRGGWAMMG